MKWRYLKASDLSLQEPKLHPEDLEEDRMADAASAIPLPLVPTPGALTCLLQAWWNPISLKVTFFGGAEPTLTEK